MNSLSFAFVDAVCQRLSGPMLCKFEQISRLWSKVGAIHEENRREYELRLKIRDTAAASSRHFFDFFETRYSHGYRHPSQIQWVGIDKDFNRKYDRITSIWLYRPGDGQVCLSRRKADTEFVISVLPRLLSVTADCELWAFCNVDSHPLLKEFYRIFKHCSGFKSMRISNQMKECSDFLERQLQYGNLQSVRFSHYCEQEPWPESLTPLLKRFVRSPNFRILSLDRTLRVDFELASLFMERWRSNTLKEGSGLAGYISFPKADLRLFHPNHEPVQKRDRYGYEVHLGDGGIEVFEDSLSLRMVHMQYGLKV